jgi:hypothetical protein
VRAYGKLTPINCANKREYSCRVILLVLYLRSLLLVNSHGAAIGGIVDGCPPGLELSAEDLQIDLDRS